MPRDWISKRLALGSGKLPRYGLMGDGRVPPAGRVAPAGTFPHVNHDGFLSPSYGELDSVTCQVIRMRQPLTPISERQFAIKLCGPVCPCQNGFTERCMKAQSFFLGTLFQQCPYCRRKSHRSRNGSTHLKHLPRPTSSYLNCESLARNSLCVGVRPHLNFCEFNFRHFTKRCFGWISLVFFNSLLHSVSFHAPSLAGR